MIERNLILQVVAGVMVDAHGRLMLAQRPPGKHLAGVWEFPGGKLEPGETAVAALRRELREELAIDADQIDPEALVSVPGGHADRPLCLHAHRVRHWSGRPQSCEGQALVWCLPANVDATSLAPADRTILDVLCVRLPKV